MEDGDLLETSSQLQSPILRSWSTQSQTIKAVLTRPCRYITHIYLSQSRILPRRLSDLSMYRHKKQLKRACIHSNMDTQPASIMNWYLFHLLHLPTAPDYRFCHRVLQGAKLTTSRQNKARSRTNVCTQYPLQLFPFSKIKQNNTK